MRTIPWVIFLSSGLLGCSAQVPSLEFGSPISSPGGATWLREVQGNDAYLQIKVETNAPDANQPGSARTPCSTNLFKRWASREGSSVVLVGLNGAAATPVLTNEISDQAEKCERLYLTRPIGPRTLVPAAGAGAEPVVAELRVVNSGSVNVSVGRIVADGLVVAGAVSGVGAAPALAAAGVIAKVGEPLAQDALDGALRAGSASDIPPIRFDLDAIRQDRLVWTVPVRLAGDSAPLANIVLRGEVSDSIFRPDWSPGTIPPTLDFSGRNARLVASATRLTLLGSGQRVSLREWFAANYPGGAPALEAVISDLDGDPAAAGTATALRRFCDQVNAATVQGTLPLTPRDRAIALWALLSDTQAWGDPVLFPPGGNACLDSNAYGVLRDIRVRPPGPSAQPPLPAG